MPREAQRAWSGGDRSTLESLTRIVMRGWSTGKAWLYRELNGRTGDGL